MATPTHPLARSDTRQLRFSRLSQENWRSLGGIVTQTLTVTPREINARVAFAASDWVAGPTAEVVEKAIIDRQALLG
jgi:hypothetical protein